MYPQNPFENFDEQFNEQFDKAARQAKVFMVIYGLFAVGVGAALIWFLIVAAQWLSRQ